MTTKSYLSNSNVIIFDCLDSFYDDSYTFFQLVEENVDLNEFIHPDFQTFIQLTIKLLVENANTL